MFKRIIALLLVIGPTALFALDLELTQGVNSALPIAINSFGNDNAAQVFTNVVNNDLHFSGRFKLVPLPARTTEEVPFQLWRQAGADSLLTGHVVKTGFNRYEVSYKLIDAVAQGRVLLSSSFQVNGNELRSLAHHISDLVYEKLTGERGVFSTRIAYILVQRQGGRARYSLEVADVDGYNPHSLLVSSAPIMSPSWSPDGRQIAYVSFEKKKAQIFIVSVETGRRRLVTDFMGLNGAPTWSPDGRELAVVLSKGGNPKVYSVNLTDGNLKQLTFGEAIDTEPRFSPDGRSLLFTSGRGGSPQIYKLDLALGSVSRVTYEGNYNARASYTPDQKHIAIFHRDEKSRFNIAVQDVDTGHINQLTFSSLAESPSVAPNGRLILYATRYQDKGVLGIVSIDGRIKVRLPIREGDVQEPAWSPYLM
ncbi:TolB colicin import protein [Legionella beliardensis]|uniref:Tol-Pal system protein TolB n=1 Tax=Legionella beliardensis TaxID=91822 RepID=A0A378I1U8_9GAMM|nr:Tol-Pal system beta propeller repeat protein TolB [Legionella beliardensis]STX29148.1 TolB colicin import protein [Legionella beliardensis]